MLAKFKVSNFKSFNEEVTFDLTDTNGYTFNKDSIKNDIVNSALVYGHNGVGKSNLGLAIFDIIEHLTDGKKNDSGYEVYLNAYSKKKYAQFSYEFLIEGAKLLKLKSPIQAYLSSSMLKTIPNWIRMRKIKYS